MGQAAAGAGRQPGQHWGKCAVGAGEPAACPGPHPRQPARSRRHTVQLLDQLATGGHQLPRRPMAQLG
eukprot:12938099-Heterocapsa_arctica.AAC.1